MEANGLSSRMYSASGGVSMLGLAQPQPPQNPHQHHLPKHPKVVAVNHPHHLQPPREQQHTQLSMKQPSNYMTYSTTNSNPNPNPNSCQKSKTQGTQMTNSDEDEPGCANDQENSSLDGKRKGGSSTSPWQRMKWSDTMVRLLIMAVYYIGDEAGNEVVSDKKKAGGGGGAAQKKGKWKSVSRAMMEKGFYVSPQQCEDKFNDLNKRYKRVNDILGRGTACRVVENQGLLDGMEIAPKMKEEVRKLLNSKHLFFREMCAYHNSCGHGSGGMSITAEAEAEAEAAASASAGAALETSVSVAEVQQHNPQSLQHQQQMCLHSSVMPPSNPHKLGLVSDDDEDDGDDDDEYDEFDEEEDEHEFESARKRARTDGGGLWNLSQGFQKLSGEVMGMLQDGSKNQWEKKQWMKTQLVQLEEQGLKFQIQALELEKQRWKWIKFSSKKEREMEKMKIDNERKKLENERMMLLLRQKEIELIVDTSNPSCVSA